MVVAQISLSNNYCQQFSFLKAIILVLKLHRKLTPHSWYDNFALSNMLHHKLSGKDKSFRSHEWWCRTNSL